MVLNRLKGGLKVVAIKAPGFGDNRKSTVKDIAIATGASLFNDDALGLKLEDIKESDFGEVGEVIVTKDDTLMLNGKGSAAEVAHRCEEIDDAISASNSEYEKVLFSILYLCFTFFKGKIKRTKSSPIRWCCYFTCWWCK